MFESAAIDHTLDKETLKRELPILRTGLLAAQYRLLDSRAFPLIVLVTGQDLAGKGQAIQRLYEWLDPRHLRANAYGEPSEDERLRPELWRYWRDLPARGEIGMVFGSWYNDAIRACIRKGAEEELDSRVARINAFERLLADEGALILKFLLVISPEERKRRQKLLKKTVYASRHVLEEWTDLGPGRQLRPVAEQYIARTSTAHAPWIVVPADSPDYRDLLFGRTILGALEKRLGMKNAPRSVAPALVGSLDGRTVLDALDLTKKLDKGTYEKRLAEAQYRIAMATDAKAFRKRALLCVFEGADAAGKGSTIRRLTVALDPRRYRVWPIAAPSDEERLQPYLWRFWRRLPRLGHTAIFDRSWYGRVLVERVEGFAPEPAWLRAYGEINEFESELVRHGMVLVKFWLTISAEEQLRRFEERQNTPWKQHKITEEDWRNREKWHDYEQAVSDMVDRTSTVTAPWTLVEAEDKRWGRVRVLETIAEQLEAAL